jgi:hypothetical protein
MKRTVTSFGVATLAGLGFAVLCLMLFNPEVSQLAGESEAALMPAPVFYLPTLISVAPLGEFFSHDFETGDLTGWTMKERDTAFPTQPTFGDNSAARGDAPSNHEGSWWVSTFEKFQGPNDPFLKTGKGRAQELGGQQGNARQGRIVSIEFEIVGARMNLLVGGGDHAFDEKHPQGEGWGANAVNLEVGGLFKAKRTASGIGIHTMQRVEWEMDNLKGKMATIAVYDKDAGGGGWTSFDDVNQLKVNGKEVSWKQLLAVQAFGKLATTFGQIKSSR